MSYSKDYLASILADAKARAAATPAAPLIRAPLGISNKPPKATGKAYASTRASKPRILFHPKGEVAVLSDAQWIKANSHTPKHELRTVGEAYASGVRMRSTDYDMPRSVCGEAPAIKAEGYWSTALHTERMRARELKK